MGFPCRDLHGHSVFKLVKRKVDGLRKHSDDNLWETSDREDKVIHVYFCDADPGPSGLEGDDKVEHEHPKLGGGDELAKPEPAVMPLVATTVLECTLSKPTVRRSLYAAGLSLSIMAVRYPFSLAASPAPSAAERLGP